MIHGCLDIRGALGWRKSQLRGMFVDELGRKQTADQCREILLDELAKGRKVLPLGDPCEGFSFDTGCPGHTEPGEKSG